MVAVPIAFRAAIGPLLQIIDVRDLGIVLLLQAFRKALAVRDAAHLTLDAVEKSGVLQVGAIALRFASADSEIEFDFDGKSTDAQVFESRASEMSPWERGRWSASARWKPARPRDRP